MRNISSLKEQDFRNYEHIFVDGKSTDSTVSIIKNNAENFKLISQKDDGIYDAMNKGIDMSNGRNNFFLNSDDYLFAQISCLKLLKN